MNYKTVFQLAQHKGCMLYSFQMKTNAKGEIFPDNITWCLALIQKWLRDEHKILVLVEYYQPSFREGKSWRGGYMFMDFLQPFFTNTQQLGQTYEMAMLEGINQALKLI